MDYIQIAQAFTAVIPIPGSLNTDTVTYAIYKASDNSTVFSGSMTFVADEVWKVTFTPATADTYILKVNDVTIDSKRENIYKAVGTIPTTDPTTPSGIDLTTLEKVKSFLTIEDTDDDTSLQRILTAVSRYVETYCDRLFISQSFTEYHNGNGENGLVLRQYPVTAVSAVYDDTSRLYPASTLIPASEYVWWEDGRLELDENNCFSSGRKNIKVTYTAGWAQASIPEDIQLAVWRICQFIYKDSKTSIAGPEQLDVAGMILKFRNSEVREILDRYRKISTR